ELAAGALDDRRSRPLRRPGRYFLRLAGHAELERAPRTPSEKRNRSCALAAEPAGSVARPLPGPAGRSRPCAVEARFSRRQRLVRDRAEAGGESRGRRVYRFTRSV